jgi:hypothetical protein
VYNFAIYSGIHAIKIEVEEPIPSRVYLAGHKAFIIYDGHQQSCYYCNETTHISKIVRHDWNTCEFVDMGASRAFCEVICQHLLHELRDPDEVSNKRRPELHATDEPTPTVTRDPQAARGHGKEAHRNPSNELEIENNSINRDTPLKET